MERGRCWQGERCEMWNHIWTEMRTAPTRSYNINTLQITVPDFCCTLCAPSTTCACLSALFWGYIIKSSLNHDSKQSTLAIERPKMSTHHKTNTERHLRKSTFNIYFFNFPSYSRQFPPAWAVAWLGSLRFHWLLLYLTEINRILIKCWKSGTRTLCLFKL